MKQDDQKNIKLYQNLLSEHGDSFRSLDWGSQESQIKRFKILADIGISNVDSVLDVGCGLADFNEWLQKHCPGVNYSGIDITPEMISHAKIRYPKLELFNKTIFEIDAPDGSYDYLTASGIFAFRKENPHEYVFATIEKMFNLCRKGIAVNSLSLWASTRATEEFYADPLVIIDFARTLTPRVVLRHDYHPSDFTIYLYR